MAINKRKLRRRASLLPSRRGKQDEVLASLRGQIISGQLPPGSQLPTRVQLEKQFDVSTITIQRALDYLVDGGFVIAAPKRGTFVVEHPPHLYRYGLIFPRDPASSRSWLRLWDALVKEVGSIVRNSPIEMPVYYNINGQTQRTNEGFHELLNQLDAQRFAGLIFASNPDGLENTPILDAPGVPRVAIMGLGESHPNVARVLMTREPMIRRGISYLAERGRKRLGVLVVSTFQSAELINERLGFIRQIAAIHGMETRPYWIQVLNPSAAVGARSCVHLMFRPEQADRPDALFVMDDHLVEFAAAGLIDAGVRIPEDLDVVAHSNFPWPAPSMVPMRRIGFDVRTVLKQCINCLARQRRGETGVIVEETPVVFDDELEDHNHESLHQLVATGA